MEKEKPDANKHPARCTVEVEMNDLVLPGDTNAYNTMFGGRLLELVDRAASICSTRYSGEYVVTASVEAVDFLAPIKLGQFVRIKSKIVHTGRTSMMVRVRVFADDPVKKIDDHCLTAYVNMVAVNRDGKPVPVPPLAIETDEEKCDLAEAMLIREATLARRKRRNGCGQ